MIATEIKENIISALGKIGVTDQEVVLDRPANISFGDYSTSIALKLTKTLKKNPVQIAEEIVAALPKNDKIAKVEVVKPGFINFWISPNYLLDQLDKINKEGISFYPYHLGQIKKVAIEFAHPNPFKLFHIGHLRNITTGEAVCRILETMGNTVIRFNYQGDVGLHIAKCLWHLRTIVDDVSLNEKPLKERIKILGESYAKGNHAYESDEQAKAEIIEINRKIYDKDTDILKLWEIGREWSLEYFRSLYKRVYTHFDREYFESEMAERAIEISYEAQKKGILEKSEGAIVFKGEKYGLDTRVFINALGFPTYEGKELALAEKELSDFGELDKCIHVVGPEQASFFKVTFKVEELLDPEKYKDKQMHLIYGWVRLKNGKMSSRSGNVIEGEWLLDESKQSILHNFKCTPEIAEKLAIAAVKYSFLKNDRMNEVAFDFNESISLEGNSGPYLLYTYARMKSVLVKDELKDVPAEVSLNDEESQLLRLLSTYNEYVGDAARNFAPNVICNYLYDLTKIYNLFYQKHQILKADEDTKQLRLALTQATAQVLKNGLYLLGIETVEKI